MSVNLQFRVFREKKANRVFFIYYIDPETGRRIYVTDTNDQVADWDTRGEVEEQVKKFRKMDPGARIEFGYIAPGQRESFMLLIRDSDEDEWKVVLNPVMSPSVVSMSDALKNEAINHMEYESCGRTYRMIRTRNSASYGITKVMEGERIYPVGN